MTNTKGDLQLPEHVAENGGIGVTTRLLVC